MALPETFEWSQLTNDQSEILEAYFALFRGAEPTSIGSGEILSGSAIADARRSPESLVRTVLAAVDVPRRGGGRPSNESRAATVSPPLTTVRPQTPRGRKSPRG
nr:hypothetical protein [Deltaproteobacteria bacterium]